MHPLKTAVLVDLARGAKAGGHVKCWERLAKAAAESDLPLDLTVYFSGDQPTEILAPHVRLRHLPPVFSTARLEFLPYVPDHTDLSPHHPALAKELTQFDVIHTTDGFFAFAQTAERASKRRGIPLTTSFHTDTPSYTRIFTRQTLDKMVGKYPSLHKKLVTDWDIPARQGNAMLRKLQRHVRHCSAAMVTREEDHQLADSLLGKEHVGHLRLGADKTVFNPSRRNRGWMEQTYRVPADKIVFLFVGRVDVGKNIYTLANALRRCVDMGLPVHLIVAGVGPATDDVRKILGDHVSLPGYVMPDDLAKLYASVDALALSSEVEIRSMAGVEAMASSCPVLVSEKSGIAQLFDNTPAMRVVPSGVDAWTEALSQFVQDKSVRDAMRSSALDFSVNKLATWQDVLRDDLFAVWQRVAQAAHKSSAA